MAAGARSQKVVPKFRGWLSFFSDLCHSGAKRVRICRMGAESGVPLPPYPSAQWKRGGFRARCNGGSGAAYLRGCDEVSRGHRRLRPHSNFIGRGREAGNAVVSGLSPGQPGRSPPSVSKTAVTSCPGRWNRPVVRWSVQRPWSNRSRGVRPACLDRRSGS